MNKKLLAVLAVVGYIGTIVLANWMTTTFGLVGLPQVGSIGVGQSPFIFFFFFGRTGI